LSSSSLSQFLEVPALAGTKQKQSLETILHHTSEDSLASKSDFILDTQQLVDFQFVSWGKTNKIGTKRLIPM
jgi:hypothetical protein